MANMENFNKLVEESVKDSGETADNTLKLKRIVDLKQVKIIGKAVFETSIDLEKSTNLALTDLYREGAEITHIEYISNRNGAIEYIVIEYIKKDGANE